MNVCSEQSTINDNLFPNLSQMQFTSYAVLSSRDVTSDARCRRLARPTSVNSGGGGREATGCSSCRLAARLKPATREDAPVGSTEVGVAESVTERIHGTVDVAQPVSCTTQNVQSESCV